MKRRPTKGSQKELKSPRFKSVEDYLTSVDPTKARTLRSVIDLILVEFPELESKIFWNGPTIHRKGKYVAGICAYKHHLTFAPWSPRVIEDFKGPSRTGGRLYRLSRGCPAAVLSAFFFT